VHRECAKKRNARDEFFWTRSTWEMIRLERGCIGQGKPRAWAMDAERLAGLCAPLSGGDGGRSNAEVVRLTIVHRKKA